MIVQRFDGFCLDVIRRDLRHKDIASTIRGSSKSATQLARATGPSTRQSMSERCWSCLAET